MKKLGCRAVLALVLLLGLAGSPPGWAAEGVVQVPLGGVKQIAYQAPILRLSVGNPELVEVSSVSGSSTEVLLKGRQIGSTSLAVWGRDGGQASFVVQVVADVDALGSAIKDLFPGEQVAVQVAGETLLLKGTVSGPEALQAVSDWAEGYRSGLGKEGTRLRVLNRLQLATPQQVQLEVRFAEVSRTSLRRLGLSLLGHKDGNTMGVFSSTEEFGIRPSGAFNDTLPLPVPFTEAAKLVFITKPDASFPFSAVLSALSANGVAKTLSEPTLVALSGQQASLLVGGEQPYLVPLGSQGQYTMEWKTYGIQLDFLPMVLADQTIQLKVNSVVSDLDKSNAINLAGVAVAPLTTRSSSTTVRLRSGQGFAIAGMLSDRLRSTVAKVPLLGDIPILGMLFRTTQSQREETELVVVVTARLVQPVDGGELGPLPGESDLADPNGVQLFLMGWGEVEPKKATSGTGRGRPAGRGGYR